MLGFYAGAGSPATLVASVLTAVLTVRFGPRVPVVASGLVLAAGDEWQAAWWVFPAIGLVAAAAAWRVLTPGAETPAHSRARPPLGWFVNTPSVRLLVIALEASISSGAYFAYAPDTTQVAGLANWTGPAMWAARGIAGISGSASPPASR